MKSQRTEERRQINYFDKIIGEQQIVRCPACQLPGRRMFVSGILDINQPDFEIIFHRVWPGEKFESSDWACYRTGEECWIRTKPLGLQTQPLSEEMRQLENEPGEFSESDQ